jgi:chromate transporter
MDHIRTPHPTLSELAAASLTIGLLGFGGPAGQIALMHKVFVDDKKWIDEDRYLYALSYCTLLPGPEAQQLATYIGWLLHGVRGGLIAGTLFVAPGALIMLALSWLYMTSANMPLVAASLYGLRCVVLALIIQSVIKIGAKSLKLTWTKWVAGISFLALVVLHVPFPIVILVAGLVGWGVQRIGQGHAPQHVQQAPMGNSKHSFRAAAVWIGAWLAPVIAFSLLPSAQPILGQIGQLFSGLSLVTFGGAYAATAWLNQQAVEVQNWLTATQMMDGLALVQAIPGPLVLVNQYVGFVAGWNAGGLGLALAGGLLASWCTFAPSFVWIFAGAPFAEKLRHNLAVAFALKGVSAAVVGVIASLAVWFGAKVVFGEETIDWRAIDWKAVLMILAAFGLLTRTKLGLFPLLVLGAFGSIMVSAIG